jgi:L-iditol 2-dehydrogenase
VEANLTHYNELGLTGQTGALHSHYEMALGLIEPGRIDAGTMVTHRFPLWDTTEAIEMVAGGVGI